MICLAEGGKQKGLYSMRRRINVYGEIVTELIEF